MGKKIEYDRDGIYNKLKQSIQHLRGAIKQMLAAGSYEGRRSYKMSDEDFYKQIGVIADMLHEVYIDNITVFGMLEKHSDLKAAFEEIRKEIAGKLHVDIEAEAKAQEHPQARIILPGNKRIGARQIIQEFRNRGKKS